MRAGSLFSGYGGLSRAVEEAFGATTAWVADVEPAACRVLERRFPGVPNLGDVTAVDWSAVEPVDIIEGGSPCQDISAAGKRAGMTDGTRSNLWVAMREAIAIVKPTYVIWENVNGAHSAAAASSLEPCPGCVGDGGGKPALRALGRVLGDLAELGFDAEWRSVRASDVGACHQRRRVFILAWRRDVAHGQGHKQREQAESRPLRPQFGNGAGARLTLPTPSVTDMGRDKTPAEWDEWADAMKVRHGNGNGHGASLHVEARRASLPTPSVADAMGGHERRGGARGDELLLPGIVKSLPTPVADNSRGLPSTGTDYQSLPNEVIHHWGQYATAITRHEQTLGRPAPEPTIPGARGGRKLSGEFTEWMMMLPAGWIWELVLAGVITNNEALKLCGNGVVTPQAVYALRLMLPHVPRGIAP